MHVGNFGPEGRSVVFRAAPFRLAQTCERIVPASTPHRSSLRRSCAARTAREVGQIDAAPCGTAQHLYARKEAGHSLQPTGVGKHGRRYARKREQVSEELAA